MRKAALAQVHPLLGTRDIEAAIRFYVERLGFTLAFRDGSVPTNYVGFRRDGVEIHMQFQHDHEMSASRLRFLVDDPDVLHAEYQAKGITVQTPLADTPWGTREFAIYDPDRNALAFYRPLNRAG